MLSFTACCHLNNYGGDNGQGDFNVTSQVSPSEHLDTDFKGFYQCQGLLCVHSCVSRSPYWICCHCIEWGVKELGGGGGGGWRVFLGGCVWESGGGGGVEAWEREVLEKGWAEGFVVLNISCTHQSVFTATEHLASCYSWAFLRLDCWGSPFCWDIVCLCDLFLSYSWGSLLGYITQ